MWIRDWLNCKVLGVPLYIIGVCGLAGILVDIDHPLAYMLKIPDGRFLHIPFLAGAMCIILYCGARAGGLLIKMVLKKRSEGEQGRRKK